MSDTFSIPVDYERTGPPTITITPDLARQIVALSAVPAFEANTLDRLASIEDHCNRMLELTKMGLQNKDSLKNIRSVLESEPFLGEAHQSDLEKAHEIAAEDRSCGPTPLDMTRQIGPGIVDARHAPMQAEPFKTGMDTETYCPPGQMLCATPVDESQTKYVPCTLCGEGVLYRKSASFGWLIAQYHACKNPAPEPVGTPMGAGTFTAPVDAGGEDAAVVAIFHAWVNDTGTEIEGMRAILAAIRAGKVPNIVDATVLSDERGLLAGQYDEIATLRARLADAERRADEMEGKAGEWIAADVHKERVESARADAVAMNKRLLGERDAAWKENARILARVAELEKALAETSYAEVETLRKENIDARADLAAERERREKAEEDHAHAKSRLDIMESLHRSDNERGQTVFGMAAALAAVEADRDHLRFALEGCESYLVGKPEAIQVYCIVESVLCETYKHPIPPMVIADRDAARSEVERLKARKVVLPEYDGVFPADAAGGGDKPWYYKESVISAIRSAGVSCG